MNCPFCNTHIDQHEVGRCADAWLGTLKGDAVVKYKSFFQLFGETKYRYGVLIHTKPPHYVQVKEYTTSLDIFMAEVMPEIIKQSGNLCNWSAGLDQLNNKDYTAEIIYWEKVNGGAQSVIHEISNGKTINEALLRTAVKVLSKERNVSDDQT